MSDRATTHAITDFAAPYALGALSQHEARSFEEHLAEGCDDCSAQLESFEQTVSALALCAEADTPSATVRADLVARMSTPVVNQTESASRPGDSGQFVSILAADGKWHEVQPGISLKNLFVDQATGLATSLVRMSPGTSLPAHQHIGVEQFFVIEGDCNVAGQKLKSGDYHRAAAGSTHETTYTVDGTMFLLVAPEHYEVLDAS